MLAPPLQRIGLDSSPDRTTDSSRLRSLCSQSPPVSGGLSRLAFLPTTPFLHFFRQHVRAFCVQDPLRYSTFLGFVLGFLKPVLRCTWPCDPGRISGHDGLPNPDVCALGRDAASIFLETPLPFPNFRVFSAPAAVFFPFLFDRVCFCFQRGFHSLPTAPFSLPDGRTSVQRLGRGVAFLSFFHSLFFPLTIGIAGNVVLPKSRPEDRPFFPNSRSEGFFRGYRRRRPSPAVPPADQAGGFFLLGVGLPLTYRRHDGTWLCFCHFVLS